MFCRYCGAEISENAKFCVSCGRPVEAQPVQATYVGDDGLVQPVPKMKWYKFLIYFSLWAGALLNIGNGLMALQGMQYETGSEVTAELVYAMFDGLKTLDVLYGAACIALAVYMIVIRFRLAGYYKNGPAMFISTYAIVLLINVIYYVAVITIVPEIVEAGNVKASIVGTAIGNVLMIILNSIYFKKRKHLFFK
ncbi:MAG: zinc ribbon domain-containing protein [Clostridia bacterium]|nr:zinc ribbon domain-containing protein [Clostridia bacterium]